MKRRNNLTYDIVLSAILAVVLFVGQVALNAIPNAEVVFLLIICIAIFTPLSKKFLLLISIIFVMLEGVYYGFHIWFFVYLLVIPFYMILARLLKRVINTPLKAAFFSMILGLFFDVFFALANCLLSMNFVTFFPYLLSGIWFSIVHAIANYVIMLLLYEPLRRFFLKYFHVAEEKSDFNE